MKAKTKPLTEKDTYEMDLDPNSSALESYRYDMFYKKDVLSALRGVKKEIKNVCYCDTREGTFIGKKFAEGICVYCDCIKAIDKYFRLKVEE